MQLLATECHWVALGALGQNQTPQYVLELSNANEVGRSLLLYMNFTVHVLVPTRSLRLAVLTEACMDRRVTTVLPDYR